MIGAGKEVRTEAVAHGCTEKTDGQAHFELTLQALNPALNMMIPWKITYAIGFDPTDTPPPNFILEDKDALNRWVLVRGKMNKRGQVSISGIGATVNCSFLSVIFLFLFCYRKILECIG